MWSNPAIDNLLNPEYDKVTDYRKLFRLIGIEILIDNGTRNDAQTGEAHCLLLRRRADGKLGILFVHDQYATGLPPQFCMPNFKAVTRFRDRLESEIIWFEDRQDIERWFAEGCHLDNPIYKTAPLIMGFFYRDVLEYLDENNY